MNDFMLAEVVGTYTGSYLDTPSTALYTILVNTFEDSPQTLYCKPVDLNIKKIPLIGEHVRIFSSIGAESTNDIDVVQWYYSDIIPVQTSIHNNSLPGLTNISINTSPNYTQTTNNTVLTDITFEERGDVPVLQPYEGDLLIEGRFGNSIRVGSSHALDERNRYSKPQNTGWVGGNGSPIIIISNKRPNTPKKFQTESVMSDYSSLYLTSDQEIKTIELSKQLEGRVKSDTFRSSQLIGSADRILLQSKQDSIILDAKQDVVILTNNLHIGSDNAEIPMIDTLKLVSILRKLLLLLSLGGTDTASGAPVLLRSEISDLMNDLDELKIDRYRISKKG